MLKYKNKVVFRPNVTVLLLLYCTMCVASYKTLIHIIVYLVPVAARSKAWVCDCSLAGIAGSNPAGGMGACLL